GRARGRGGQRAAQLALPRAPPARLDDVEDLLVKHALERDSPLALRDRQLLRPGISTLERLVASARARAERDAHKRLEPVLEAGDARALDALCVTDVRFGVSRLAWLGERPRRRAPRRSSGSVDVQDGELHVRRLPGAERPETTTALAAHIASRL